MTFRGLTEEAAFIHSLLYFKIIPEKPKPEREAYLDSTVLALL